MISAPLRVADALTIRIVVLYNGFIWGQLETQIKGARERICGSGKYARSMTLDAVDVQGFVWEHEGEDIGAALKVLREFHPDQFKFIQGWED